MESLITIVKFRSQSRSANIKTEKDVCLSVMKLNFEDTSIIQQFKAQLANDILKNKRENQIMMKHE